MKQRIIELLAERRHPMTVPQIADALDAHALDVRHAVLELVCHSDLMVTGRQPLTGECLVRETTIGRCEWCGVFDHHLVDAECGVCRNRSVQRPSAAMEAL